MFVFTDTLKQFFFWIIGRKKDLIIRGGMNISPGRVEAELGRFWDEGEFSIVGLPDPVLGEKTALLYESQDVIDKESERNINKRVIA